VTVELLGVCTESEARGKQEGKAYRNVTFWISSAGVKVGASVAFSGFTKFSGFFIKTGTA